ncbi:DJ-1/PfpI family protein [Ramlibacter sp. WS9]|uniref:DJ-1/PfpI family protein n=1 Tax=Ramlibacter sp. WS9 TaxID=1882741 RepID=UPI001142910B|nr:DJ-1/PfpI family protein [Ramlibacter sp. WS9]ROZ78224.1 DJ-1/PfpI family protein [Ramlibacter sp. WS9]
MRLTILLMDGFTALDIVGGYEVLANVPGTETEFAAQAQGLVWADSRRLALHAWRSFAELSSTDILYVPGGPGVAAALNDNEMIETIRRLHETSTWTVGICNGVELLGRAGLLDGKQVTTNWGCRDRVRAYGAAVNSQRFHRDGKLVTGAGVSASIDAGLFLVQLLRGPELAATLQLGIEYYPAPPLPYRSPEEAPAQSQALIRHNEQNGPRRIKALRPPV